MKNHKGNFQMMKIGLKILKLEEGAQQSKD